MSSDLTGPALPPGLTELKSTVDRLSSLLDEYAKGGGTTAWWLILEQLLEVLAEFRSGFRSAPIRGRK